jgi:hypothetical protein
MIAPSDQERPPRWKNHPAEEWVICIAWSLMFLPVLWLMPLRSLHTHVCLLVPLIFVWLPHCCSFPELGPMTQTDLLAPLWLHVNMTERTNRIGDLTRHRVFWGSPLMVPLRVHMLSIDYQNYQTQRIMVINKIGRPAYWTRQIEVLNCQPT